MLDPCTARYDVIYCRRSEEGVWIDTMNKLMPMGVLEEATSAWAAHNVFVRKTYGGIRVPSDCRRLNEPTITKPYPMDRVRDMLDWVF